MSTTPNLDVMLAKFTREHWHDEDEMRVIVPAGVTVSLSALHARSIVLYIEGTTTPIEFVYQVLFPFARARVAEFLSREWDSAACRDAVALLRGEQLADTDDVRDAARDDVR